MPTSDEDLQKMQDEVESLREKVAAEEAKRVERERSIANDVTAADLSAEKARLETQLAEAKRYSSAGAVKEGVSAPLDAAKENQKRAEAQAKALADAAEAAKATKSSDSSTDK